MSWLRGEILAEQPITKDEETKARGEVFAVREQRPNCRVFAEGMFAEALGVGHRSQVGAKQKSEVCLVLPCVWAPSQVTKSF